MVRKVRISEDKRPVNWVKVYQLLCTRVEGLLLTKRHVIVTIINRRQVVTDFVLYLTSMNRPINAVSSVSNAAVVIVAGEIIDDLYTTRVTVITALTPLLNHLGTDGN